MAEGIDKADKESLAKTLDLLQKALIVEYSIIIYYPRLAERLPDDASRKTLYWMGEQSVRHADVVSQLIRRLGGTPEYSFEPYPEGDILIIMRQQLEKEKLARFLYKEAQNLVTEALMATELGALVTQEEGHIKGVEIIIQRLVERP